MRQPRPSQAARCLHGQRAKRHIAGNEWASSGLGQTQEAGPGGEALIRAQDDQTLSEKEERGAKASEGGQECVTPAGHGAGAQEGDQEGGQVQRLEASEHAPSKPGCNFAPVLRQTDRKDQCHAQ